MSRKRKLDVTFPFGPAGATLARPRSSLPIVTPGEPIIAEPGFLRGHGTLVNDEGKLVATVAGVVERVNKLVSVRPLRSRYVGEVGDVVVGRIAEVGQKRWKAEVGGRQDAVLMLSSINLPGGEQRRRTAEDQLNMRQFYVEHDLFSAEVQAFFQDGSMSLHTRSLAYGKLRDGVLVQVAPSLMKRLKQHFHAFEFGVHCIFGMNGYVWVSARAPGTAAAAAAADAQGGESPAAKRAEAAEGGEAGDATSGAAASTAQGPPTAEERERVARVRNALVALNQLSIAVSPASVFEVYRASLAAGMRPKDMLLPELLPDICRGALTAQGDGSAPREAAAPEDGS